MMKALDLCMAIDETLKRHRDVDEDWVNKEFLLREFTVILENRGFEIVKKERNK